MDVIQQALVVLQTPAITWMRIQADSTGVSSADDPDLDGTKNILGKSQDSKNFENRELNPLRYKY